MKFEHQYDNSSEKIVMDLHRDVTLSEALECFERFLRASGYVFTGTLVIEHNKESENE